MDRLAINFGIFFGIMGFLISLVFSFLSKNPIFAILTNILISTIISIIVGIVIFFILKQKVPEILEIFEINIESTKSYGLKEDYEETLDYSEDSLETSESFNVSKEEAPVDESPSININSAEKTEHFGDHIIVDKITIKNEPKLMAEAIRTMLSKDE